MEHKQQIDAEGTKECFAQYHQTRFEPKTEWKDGTKSSAQQSDHANNAARNQDQRHLFEVAFRNQSQ